MELLFTVGIIFALLTMAVPSFQGVIQGGRITTATNDLVSALNLARSEAIRRNLRTTVCTSASGTACTPGSGWEQGWIVFTDPDNDGVYTGPPSVPNETILRVRDSVEGRLTMVGNTNVADYISYVARGHSELTTGAFQAGTIKICDNRTGEVGRNLKISTSGRIRIEREITCP